MNIKELIILCNEVYAGTKTHKEVLSKFQRGLWQRKWREEDVSYLDEFIVKTLGQPSPPHSIMEFALLNLQFAQIIADPTTIYNALFTAGLAAKDVEGDLVLSGKLWDKALGMAIEMRIEQATCKTFRNFRRLIAQFPKNNALPIQEIVCKLLTKLHYLKKLKFEKNCFLECLLAICNIIAELLKSDYSVILCNSIVTVWRTIKEENGTSNILAECCFELGFSAHMICSANEDMAMIAMNCYKNAIRIGKQIDIGLIMARSSANLASLVLDNKNIEKQVNRKEVQSLLERSFQAFSETGDHDSQVSTGKLLGKWYEKHSNQEAALKIYETILKCISQHEIDIRGYLLVDIIQCVIQSQGLKDIQFFIKYSSYAKEAISIGDENNIKAISVGARIQYAWLLMTCNTGKDPVFSKTELFEIVEETEAMALENGLDEFLGQIYRLQQVAYSTAYTSAKSPFSALKHSVEAGQKALLHLPYDQCFRERIDIHLTLATCLSTMGYREHSIECLEKAYELLRKIGKPAELSHSIIISLINDYAGYFNKEDKAKHEKMESLCKEALELMKSMPSPAAFVKMCTHKAISRAAHEAGNYEKEEIYLRKALDDAKELSHIANRTGQDALRGMGPQDVIDRLADLGQLLIEQNRLDEALDTCTEAARIADQLLQKSLSRSQHLILAGEDAHPYVLSGYQRRVFVLLSRIYYLKGNARECFNWDERGRCRVLRSILAGRIGNGYHDAEADIYRETQELVSNNPNVAILKYLFKGEALLLITAKTGISLLQLPETWDRLRKKMWHLKETPYESEDGFISIYRQWRDLPAHYHLKEKWFEALRVISTRIYDCCFSMVVPMLRKENITTIVIIPDDWLQFIPFNIAARESQASDIEYLIDEFQIIQTHSAQLTTQTSSIPPLKRRNAIFIAGAHEKLPFIQIETLIVSSSDWPTSVYRACLDFDKKEELLLILGQNYDLLHLANHTVFNDDNVLGSSINFGLENQGIESQESVSFTEIFKQALGDKFVGSDIILSSCESGAFGQDHGGDNLSLSNLFLTAGAKGVISSRWIVEDISATILILYLYGELSNSVSLSDSLRKAQIRLKQASSIEIAKELKKLLAKLPRGKIYSILNTQIKKFELSQDTMPYSHPFYWGGFIYEGSV